MTATGHSRRFGRSGPMSVLTPKAAKLATRQNVERCQSPTFSIAGEIGLVEGDLCALGAAQKTFKVEAGELIGGILTHVRRESR
jgi:hypothetical protein